jgi:hypothetical protein
MRLLLLMLLPLPAFAQGAVTLEDLGALHPDRECFTDHPDLESIGLSSALTGFDDAMFEERGGGYTIEDVGDIAFVGGPWTYDALTGDAIQGTLVEFLATHGDEYDFISMFLTEHIQFGALYAGLQNTTRGIGRPVYNQGVASHEKLMGYMFMNGIFDYLYNDVLTVHDASYFGQELGHRWGSFVARRGGGGDMLGRDTSHWSFFMDSDNSAMEGNAWVETEVQNRWEADFRAPIGYSQLDMYLMGFMAPEDVDDWLLITNANVAYNPLGWPGQGPVLPETTPYYNVLNWVPEEDWDNIRSIEVTGTRTMVSIDDVTFVNGVRDPDSSESQREFKMAFVIMHPAGEPVDFDDYLVIEDTRAGLKDLWEDMVDHEAVLDASLGTSAEYLFNPSVFTPDVVYEPELFDVDAEGDLIYDDEVASGCQASLSGSGGALLGLLMLGMRRRRA